MRKGQQFDSWRRRDVLRAGARSAAVLTMASIIPGRTMGALERASLASMTGVDTLSQTVAQSRMEALVLQAIDAAKSAGARYAEARVTRTVKEAFRGSGGLEHDWEWLEIGVRALVDGGWGFAASTYWDPDEATKLAQDAVAQARINAKVFPHPVDLGVYPVAKGTWSTPIQIDPFQISLEEKIDFMRSFSGLVPRVTTGRMYSAGFTGIQLFRQERMVATTEDALFGQTLYETGGEFSVYVSERRGENEKSSAKAYAQNIGSAGAGWERLLDAKLGEQVPALMAQADANLWLPTKPVDVGRYEVIIPASCMASFISSSFCDATQLDRAMGLEANAGGTSYLGPEPEDYLGKAIGIPTLLISANRSVDKGLATVKWDDEGVEPETFPLIEQGVLVDYQTTREQASWLAPWYQSRQRPIRSHGCAAAPTASNFTMQHTPNVSMAPDPTTTTTFDDMIKNTRRGIAMMSGFAVTDFQSRTGATSFSVFREVADGKLGPILTGAQIIFDSTELWKNIIEIGGPGSVELCGARSSKGEPRQNHRFSIEAVPCRFKEVTVIDYKRKA